MKIIISIEDLSVVGGVGRVVVNLANALVAEGYEVMLLSFYQNNDIIPYELANKIKLKFWHDYKESQRQNEAKKHFFKKLYYKNIYKLLLSYKLSKIKADYIIANDWVFFPYFKNKNTTYIKIMHGAFIRYNTRNKYFDTLIVLNRQELDIWGRYHKNIKFIPNFLSFIPKENTDHKQKVVLCAGRFSSEKGFLRLIEAWNLLAKDENFKEIKEWNLYLIGDGDEKPLMQEKIKQYSLENSIIIKPFTQDIKTMYLQASIYALPSYTECFPMALLESMGYALAPISFDIKAGVSEMIENNQNGFLIKDNDLKDYAQKLKFLMQDEKLRACFGMKAKQKVKENFTQKIIIQKYKELLKDKK